MQSEEGNKKHTYDVIVVGAGPAGCASAITLAQHNLKIGLVDVIHPNKPKVGESIPSAIKRLLMHLGIKSISDILNDDEYKPCVANASAWGTNNWHYQDAIMNPEGSGWHIDRNAFDAGLYQYAIQTGSIIIKNQVKSIFIDKSRYVVKLKKTSNKVDTLQAKWIIDATGRASKIGRSLGITKDKFSEQMAAIAWIKMVDDKDFSTRIKSVHNGWWYTALLPNQRRIIAFHGLLDEVSTLVHKPNDFIQSFNTANLIKTTISNHQIIGKIQGRDASFGKLKTIAKEQFLAVGDAAISFDPLAAQGIFFALYSGIKAGEAIIKSIEQPLNQDTFLSKYLQQIENVFQQNRRALKRYYNSEIRFLKESYWTKMQR